MNELEVIEKPEVLCGRSDPEFRAVMPDENRWCRLPAGHALPHLAYLWPRDTASGEMEEHPQ